MSTNLSSKLVFDLAVSRVSEPETSQSITRANEKNTTMIAAASMYGLRAKNAQMSSHVSRTVSTPGLLSSNRFGSGL